MHFRPANVAGGIIVGMLLLAAVRPICFVIVRLAQLLGTI